MDLSSDLERLHLQHVTKILKGYGRFNIYCKIL